MRTESCRIICSPSSTVLYQMSNTLVNTLSYRIIEHTSSDTGDCQYESIARNLRNSRIRRLVTAKSVRGHLRKHISRVDYQSIDLLWGMNDSYPEADDMLILSKRARIIRDLTGESSSSIKYWGNAYTLHYFANLYDVSFAVYNKNALNKKKLLTFYTRIGTSNKIIPLSYDGMHYNSLSIMWRGCNNQRWNISLETFEKFNDTFM